MKYIYIIVTTVFAACASAIPIPDESDLKNTPGQELNSSIDELRSHRELYIQKCSGCHGLYLPSQYSQTEWKKILPMMNQKSKLSAAEAAGIERYLLLYARHQ
jgi:hypothetical protein